MSVKVCLVLHARLTRTQNQNYPKPLSDSFGDYESNSGLRIDKRTSVENHIFFEVTIIVSICVKFQYLDICGSILETKHTLGLMLTTGVSLDLVIFLQLSISSLFSLSHYFLPKLLLHSLTFFKCYTLPWGN